MHELSIALSIIEVAVEQLQRAGGARVESVHLKLGALSGVVREPLLLAFELAREGTPLSSATLAIQDVPVQIFCQTCRQPQSVVSIQQMSCNVCGAPSAQIVHGRELEIVAMEISDEQPTPAG